MRQENDVLQNPFQHALGSELEQLALPVRRHFTLDHGRRLYRGTMRKIWHRSGWLGFALTPILYLASVTDTLFAETGENVSFELENMVFQGDDGRVRMTWCRTFYMSGKPRRFDAVMMFDEQQQIILDWFGKGSLLEAELLPTVDDGALVLRSGAQRLALGPVKIPLPAFLTAKATVREWSAEDQNLEINVVLENPLLGAFFGYEGKFSEVEG